MSERTIASHADQRGVAFTTSSAEAVRCFDDAITAYLGFRKDAAEHLDVALAADPDFAMGHCTRGYFLQLFADRTLIEMAERRPQSLGPNWRDRQAL